MFATLWFILFMFIFLLLIVLVYVFKYHRGNKLSFKYILKNSSFPMKMLVVILFLYFVSFPFQIYLLNQNEPFRINYSRTHYDKILDVGDGVVVVGHQKDNGTIRKYDYEGNLLWEKIDESYGSYDDVIYQNNTYTIIHDVYRSNLTEVVATYKKNGTNTAINRDIDYTKYQFKANIEDEEENPNITIQLIDQNQAILKELVYPYQQTFTDSNYYQYVTPYLINETKDRVFIGVNVTEGYEEYVEFRLLELDKNLNLINEYKYHNQKSIVKIIQSNELYYILWNDSTSRKSYFGLYSSRMNVILENEIIGHTPYVQSRDMILNNGRLYIFGQEYTGQSQVWFSDQYDGFLINYDISMLYNKSNYHVIGKGLGLTNGFIKDNQLYAIGDLNPEAAFLSNSRYHDDPPKGVFVIVDLDDYSVIRKILSAKPGLQHHYN